MTPLVLFCGVIAGAYVLYRVFLVGFSAVTLERSFETPARSVVCAADDSHLHDPDLLLSDAYQNRIRSQQAFTPNLIRNSLMTENGIDLGQPNYYSHGIENENSNYEVLSEADKTPFLRITNTKKDSSPDEQPAWAPDITTIESGKTYAYGFQYRSDKPVQATVEYIDKEGKAHYRNVGVLQSSSTWRQFTAHLDWDATAFRAVATTMGDGYVDTRAYDIYQISDAKLSAGLVSITFDDGWESVEDGAKKLLDAYKFRTTQYIISDVAKQPVDGYMGFDTLKQLKASGHEIASHSLTHCDQTSLSQAEVEKNAEQSKKTLEQQGLGPIKSFAYPLGQYNQMTQDVYVRYYGLIRTSNAGYNDRYFDETDIHSMGVLESTSDKEFQSWLETAKSQRQWVVLVYHRVNESGAYNVTRDQLERQLAMIKKSGLQVLPVSEAAFHIRPSS